MFSYNRVIRVKDTDITGVIYFTNQLQIALEAFEELLRVSNYSLKAMVSEGDYLLPIVHTEADFFSPISVGDEVQVKLKFNIGTTSFSYLAEISKENIEVGRVTIIHAVYAKNEKKSVPVPNELVEIFNKCNM